MGPAGYDRGRWPIGNVSADRKKIVSIRRINALDPQCASSSRYRTFVPIVNYGNILNL